MVAPTNIDNIDEWNVFSPLINTTCARVCFFFSLFPCLTLPMGMNQSARLEIKNDIQHGDELYCTHQGCRDQGVKFLYCSFCNKPVAKRNFRVRHLHLTKWKDEEGDRKQETLEQQHTKQQENPFHSQPADTVVKSLSRANLDPAQLFLNRIDKNTSAKEQSVTSALYLLQANPAGKQHYPFEGMSTELGSVFTVDGLLSHAAIASAVSAPVIGSSGEHQELQDYQQSCQGSSDEGRNFQRSKRTYDDVSRSTSASSWPSSNEYRSSVSENRKSQSFRDQETASSDCKVGSKWNPPQHLQWQWLELLADRPEKSNDMSAMVKWLKKVVGFSCRPTE
jgi:hypothetical protein